MVWASMGEEVSPDEDVPVHESPLAPLTEQETVFCDDQETTVVSPE